MKRTILALATILTVFVAVLAVFVLHPVPKVKAHQACSNRTLFGDYVMTASGQATKSSVTLPASLVGIVHFEGNGDLTGSNFYLLGNGSLSGPDSIPAGATYDVNPDCAFTMTFGAGWTTSGVIVGENGSEVIGEMVPSHGLATFDMRKVSDFDEQ